jgi:hypothetical protein
MVISVLRKPDHGEIVGFFSMWLRVTVRGKQFRVSSDQSRAEALLITARSQKFSFRRHQIRPRKDQQL